MRNGSQPPFSMIGIDHVVFLVDDLDRAVKWYEDVLGCRIGYSYPELGMEQLWCGAALIVLWDTTHPGGAGAVPPVSGGRNVDHVCIALGPFNEEAMLAHLAEHGVALDRKAFHGGSRGMGNSFYIRDPWDNRLELKGPPVYPDGRASRRQHRYWHSPVRCCIERHSAAALPAGGREKHWVRR